VTESKEIPSGVKVTDKQRNSGNRNILTTKKKTQNKHSPQPYTTKNKPTQPYCTNQPVVTTAMRKRKSLTQHRKEAKLKKDAKNERSSDFDMNSLGISRHEDSNMSRSPSPDINYFEYHQNELLDESTCRDFENGDDETSDDGHAVCDNRDNNDFDESTCRDFENGDDETSDDGHAVCDNRDNNDSFEYQLHEEDPDDGLKDDNSDDGLGDNSCIDNAMDNVELAMLTDTSSLDVDKDLVIRLLAILLPLKVFLSSRLGGGYSETKQSNCALRLSNLLVWTALNSSQKKILDESTLLLWMEELLRSEYTLLDAYCQYLEETKLHAASTIRNYLYDYG
jgi:hypothetical protein